MILSPKIACIFGCILANIAIGCRQKEDFVCATNETQTCLCTATVISAQVCREDRKGWQPCACDPVPDAPDMRPNSTSVSPPTTYAFASRFDNSVSSVGYSGQTARHVLKHDLLSFIKSATDRIIRLELDPNEMMVWLTFFYEYNSELFGDEAHGYETSLPMMQYTYSDISPQKNLIIVKRQ